MDPQQQSSGLNVSPLSLLAIFWRQKTSILVCYSILGTLSLIVVALLPDRYSSETVILVDGQKIPGNLVSTTVDRELQDRIATISKQIMSSNNLLKIIEDFGLYQEERATLVQEEIIEMMREDIGVAMETGWTKDRPGAFRVSYKGRSPTVVAAVTSRLGNLFIEENLKSREVQAEGTSEFLKGRLQEAKQMLDIQEQRVREYKEQHSGELPDQNSTVQQNLARLQLQLQNNQDLLLRAQEAKRSAESSLVSAEGSYAMISQLAERPLKLAAANGELLDEGQLSDGQRKEVFLKARLTELQARYSDQHPDVKATRVLLERVTREKDSAPESEVRTGRKPAPGMPISMAQMLGRERERIDALKSQVKTLDSETKQRSEERNKLLAEIGVYQKRMEQLPLREQELAAMMRDYETSQMHYRSLLDKIFAADTAAEMERRQKAERFTILDPARVPGRPYSPKRPRLAAIGGGISLVLAIVLCVSWRVRKNEVMGEWELPAGLPILGRLPLDNDTTAAKRIVWKPVLAMGAASVTALCVVCFTAFQIYRG